MRKDGPNEPVVEKTGQPLPVERTFVKWPWGVIALGVLVLAWVGAYLVWTGSFSFSSYSSVFIRRAPVFVI